MSGATNGVTTGGVTSELLAPEAKAYCRSSANGTVLLALLAQLTHLPVATDKTLEGGAPWASMTPSELRQHFASNEPFQQPEAVAEVMS